MISSYNPASRTASSPWWWENDSTCCMCAPALEICDARIGPTCRFIKQRTNNRHVSPTPRPRRNRHKSKRRTEPARRHYLLVETRLLVSFPLRWHPSHFFVASRLMNRLPKRPDLKSTCV